MSEDRYSLQYVPDWFVTLQEMWYEDFDINDELLRGIMVIANTRPKDHK